MLAWRRPNGLRLSCGAQLEGSQTEFYHTAWRTFSVFIEDGRRQLQARVRPPGTRATDCSSRAELCHEPCEPPGTRIRRPRSGEYRESGDTRSAEPIGDKARARAHVTSRYRAQETRPTNRRGSSLETALVPAMNRRLSLDP